MELKSEQKQIVKKLQEIVLANIVNCDDEVRKNALKQFKDVKFDVLSEIDLMEMGESPTVAAFFDERKKTIVINSSHINKPYFKHLLLHEMFHAYSFNNGKTGFYHIDSKKITINNNSTNKQSVFKINSQKLSMLNESATEFYATMFLDKKVLSYPLFIPVYANLSEVCGFDKLANLYFSNNATKLTEEVQSAFKLKDDSLAKKLFMQMDQCFNLQTGVTNEKLIVEIYKTLADMHIQKLNNEHGKVLTGEELVDLIDFDQMIDTSNISFDRVQKLNEVKSMLHNYVANYEYNNTKNNADEIKDNVDNFICKRFTFGRRADYDEYKQYFKNNLLDVFLYLDQNNSYIVDDYLLNDDLAVNEVLNFMHDDCKHVDLSNLSETEKEIFLNCILENKKHNINNPENHFRLTDVKKDFQFD